MRAKRRTRNSTRYAYYASDRGELSRSAERFRHHSFNSVRHCHAVVTRTAISQCKMLTLSYSESQGKLAHGGAVCTEFSTARQDKLHRGYKRRSTAIRHAACSHRRTKKVLPLPNSLSTHTAPPCCSTISLTTLRPSPVPSMVRCSSCCTR